MHIWKLWKYLTLKLYNFLRLNVWCVCMYVRIYVCMYVCMHACKHIHECVCIYVCKYVSMNLWMCLCSQTWMGVCMHIYMYICMHTCRWTGIHICLCLCMHVYTNDDATAWLHILNWPVGEISHKKGITHNVTVTVQYIFKRKKKQNFVFCIMLWLLYAR